MWAHQSKYLCFDRGIYFGIPGDITRITKKQKKEGKTLAGMFCSHGAGDIFSAEIAIKLFRGYSAMQAIKSAHDTTARMLTSREKETL